LREIVFAKYVRVEQSSRNANTNDTGVHANIGVRVSPAHKSKSTRSKTYQDAATDRNVRQLGAQTMEAITKQKGPTKPAGENQAAPLVPITESKEAFPDPGELTHDPAKNTITTTTPTGERKDHRHRAG
jgi:hypothetical protein